MDRDRTPILVGCGQVTQREPDPTRAHSPIELAAVAARQAAEDAGPGAGLLRQLDMLVAIRSFSDTSWRFACPFGRFVNPPKSIAARLDLNPRAGLIYTHSGGNMPQWCVNRLFEKLSAGEIESALVVGSECLATQKAATRAGIELNWQEDPGGEPEQWGVAARAWSDLEERHRMAAAITAYPLFENAIRGFYGRDIDTHRQCMGELFAQFAAVAARNPLADRRDGFKARQLAELTPRNPYIGFPYTRLMNANVFIDQAAAVVMTTVGHARRLGVPESRWVYLHGCADANDHWYISDRLNYHSSPAMRTVAAECLQMAEISIGDIDYFDLYSCFPSAVDIGCREMGLSVDDPRGLTVTGGLPYFGGPGNNYVTHSIAEMMKVVRTDPGSLGMVTANGNFVTKQSAGIYSTRPPARAFSPKPPAEYQRAIDAAAGPRLTALADGEARIETYTVMHDRSGPAFAVVFGRLTDHFEVYRQRTRGPGFAERHDDAGFSRCTGHRE